MRLNELSEAEKILKDAGYIKEIFEGGAKFCWIKKFENFVLSVCFKEHRDHNNNRVIKFKYKATFLKDIKVEFKTAVFDLQEAEQRCFEIWTILEY